jgi:hypothetical protein
MKITAIPHIAAILPVGRPNAPPRAITECRTFPSLKAFDALHLSQDDRLKRVAAADIQYPGVVRKFLHRVQGSQRGMGVGRDLDEADPQKFRI